MRAIRQFSHLILLAPSTMFAAEAPLDYFGRPVAEDSRLVAPAKSIAAPVPSSSDFGTASPYSTWGLLPYESRYAGADPRSLAVGHVSGQQRPDVAIVTSFYFDPSTDYHLLLFRPENATDFREPLLYPYGHVVNSPSVAVVDLDGQNGADVVVGAGGIIPFLATDEGTLIASTPTPSQLAMGIVTTDLDRDGWKDIVSISWSEGGMIYRNLGNGTFLPTPWSTPVQGYNMFAQGDIDDDGLVDVAVSSGQGEAPYLNLYRNSGEGTLEPLQSLKGACPGGFWGSISGVGIGDVNGDGHTDIVASSGGNSPSSCLMVFLADGKDNFKEPIYLPSYDIPQTVRVSDIDGDGLADVIVAHGGWLALGVYLQQTDGSLAPERLFPIPYASHYYTHSFEIVDLDLDGCADVALVDYNNGLVTLRGTRCDPLFASGFE